jgi:nucleotide-binding universal stress UspA family protein
MKEIILGYDGSDDGRRALAAASDLALKGATLTVVSAVQVPALVGYPPEKTQSADHPEARKALEEAREFLEGLGITADFIEAAGEPDQAIIGEAMERKADLIVVGTRGLGGAKRLVLGSVSTRLVHEAPCSVLVVR